MAKSLAFSGRQLVSFSIGDGNKPFPENSNVHAALKEYLPHESEAFLHAKQNTNTLSGILETPNAIIYIVVCCSIIVAAALTIAKRKLLSKELSLFLFLSAMIIIINSVDCATFSNVLGRYGCRVMWLIPFSALLLLFSNKRNAAPAEHRPI